MNTLENLYNDKPWQHSPRFSACIPFIYIEEGGNSNDPHDPGGKTHKGIIQREYDAFRRLKKLPAQNVFDASDDEINEIYWRQYWNPICPLLKPGVDLCQLNFSVNAGVTECIKIMQRALRVRDDGHWGVVTQSAENDCDPFKLIYAFTLKEEAFYRSLRTFRYFGKDWIGRSERCETLAEQMAEQTNVVA